MRRLSDSPLFPRVVAALVAGTMAATTMAPAALAQGAAPAEATPAPAPPTPAQKAEAKKAYNAGKKAYGSEDFAAAAEAFKQADDTIPSPHAKYWYAVSLDKADAEDAQLMEKIAAYDAYIADPGADKVGQDLFEGAAKRLDELKAKAPATVKLTSVPEGATVTVDGQAQEGPTPLELTLAAGTHKIAVGAEGYLTKEIEVTLEGTQTLEQSVELEAEPPPPAEPEPEPPPAAPEPPPPPPEEPSKVPAYVTLGIAGAGAIVGTIFGVSALQKKSDFDDNPTNELADDVERNALISDMAFGVAITLGVTGVVLLTSKEETAAKMERLPHKAKLQVAPYVGRKSGGAAARITF
jgi:hypothetical protein